MEKNKQVIEFGDILNEIDSTMNTNYSLLELLFSNYIKYIDMSWEEYIKIKRKNEIIGEFKHFNLFYYLPF